MECKVLEDWNVSIFYIEYVILIFILVGHGPETEHVLALTISVVSAKV